MIQSLTFCPGHHFVFQLGCLNQPENTSPEYKCRKYFYTVFALGVIKVWDHFGEIGHLGPGFDQTQPSESGEKRTEAYSKSAELVFLKLPGVTIFINQPSFLLAFKSRSTEVIY